MAPKAGNTNLAKTKHSQQQLRFRGHLADCMEIFEVFVVGDVILDSDDSLKAGSINLAKDDIITNNYVNAYVWMSAFLYLWKYFQQWKYCPLY